jgi:hypothetical protein
MRDALLILVAMAGLVVLVSFSGNSGPHSALSGANGSSMGLWYADRCTVRDHSPLAH